MQRAVAVSAAVSTRLEHLDDRTDRAREGVHIMNASQERRVIVVAGAGGDLGRRLVAAFSSHNVHVRALVRDGSAYGLTCSNGNTTFVTVQYDDAAALKQACSGASCVVSALNGTGEVILGIQGLLLEAAVAAGVSRFIPSDFSLDYTRTRPGDNRNMDLRRAFMRRIDQTPIRATSILNGGFTDLLTGGAPIILKRPRKILYWGDADQAFDFTTKDDVACFTAAAALDDEAPRYLRIAGDVVTSRGLAAIMTSLTQRPFGLLCAGSIARLSALIGILRALSPRSRSVFPIWQGMQYLRDMSSGRGKLMVLDNDRYGATNWTSVIDVLRAG